MGRVRAIPAPAASGVSPPPPYEAPVPLDLHAQDLARLAQANRLRTLAPATGRDFTSNDYLALATAPRLAHAAADAIARGVPLGSGGSRLLRGNHPEHEALEAEAAAAFGTEAALFFPTGYAANAALFAALPREGDLVVHDALIHASAHDGLRLGRATRVAAAHNDAEAFADAIASWRARGGTGTPWIAVESLYSMDGDRAPLADLLAVAQRHDAMLLVDEAHATGVWGSGGRGLAADFHHHANVVTLHTCGKALGCEGALVCGPALVRDVLVARARPFIFSTAPSPLIAAVVRESLRILADEPDRRTRLHALIRTAEAHLGTPPGGTQIIPVLLGDDARAMAVAARLRAAGFDVRGIRPPTVPAGTARLRIAITLHADAAAVAALAQALRGALDD